MLDIIIKIIDIIQIIISIAILYYVRKIIKNK